VTPWLTGHTFTPVSRNHSNVTGALTGQDFVATEGGGPAAMFFIHADHLNSPRLITNQAGQAVWRWEQTDPFGGNVPNENPSGLGTFTCNLRLPGQYFENETNLHYNYHRDYDPATARYTQFDPIGLRGGINGYAYVGSNPLILTDPKGLAVEWHGNIYTGGAAAGIGGQLAYFKLESECKCDKKVTISGFAAYVTIGGGAKLRGVGRFFEEAFGVGNPLSLSDPWSDCPDPSAATGPAWHSGFGGVIGVGAGFLTRWSLGRLRTYHFIEGPALGFDISATATLWGQSAVTDVKVECCKK
jgi:RHS repeat-associated protein